MRPLNPLADGEGRQNVTPWLLIYTCRIAVAAAATLVCGDVVSFCIFYDVLVWLEAVLEMRGGGSVDD